MCEFCAPIKKTIRPQIAVAVESCRAEIAEICMEMNAAADAVEIRRRGAITDDDKATQAASAGLLFGAYAIGYLISSSTMNEDTRKAARNLFRDGMAHGHVTRCCQEDANG